MRAVYVENIYQRKVLTEIRLLSYAAQENTEAKKKKGNEEHCRLGETREFPEANKSLYAPRVANTSSGQRNIEALNN